MGRHKGGGSREAQGEVGSGEPDGRVSGDQPNKAAQHNKALFSAVWVLMHGTLWHGKAEAWQW